MKCNKIIKIFWDIYCLRKFDIPTAHKDPYWSNFGRGLQVRREKRDAARDREIRVIKYHSIIYC